MLDYWKYQYANLDLIFWTCLISSTSFWLSALPCSNSVFYNFHFLLIIFIISKLSYIFSLSALPKLLIVFPKIFPLISRLYFALLIEHLYTEGLGEEMKLSGKKKKHIALARTQCANNALSLNIFKFQSICSLGEFSGIEHILPGATVLRGSLLQCWGVDWENYEQQARWRGC